MPYFFRTIENPSHRQDLFDRLARLDPGRPPRWGRLTAPEMLVHLCDQMYMPFNEHPSPPIPGPQHHPVMKHLVLYLLPWPKGVVQGPPEAFASSPTTWADDLARLRELVDRFVRTPRDRPCAEHPNFGRLSRREWGVFTYRHFDHHLRQFGV